MDVAAQPSSLIDVHAHFVTDSYREAALKAGHTNPDGMPGWPSWSVDAHLELMDKHNIAQAMLSVSSPGVHFGDDRQARALAREVNEFGAALVADHPDRFGLFASLPLPDLDGALTEASYALDELGAQGVTVETNAAGLYLGDARFEPLLDELDRRAAVVFIHPTSPACSPVAAPSQPRPMLEFLFESTRNVVDLILSGALERHPQLRIVIPHEGGVLPIVADRVETFRRTFGGGPAATATPVRELLSRLWFDLAGTPFPTQAPTLAEVVGLDHLLYGSDYCWTPATGVAEQLQTIDAAPALPGQLPWRELTTINANKLFERP